MRIDRQKPLLIRTGKRNGIWLSLAFALALHLMFLLVPIAGQAPPSDKFSSAIELQLTTTSPPSLSDEFKADPEPEVPAPGSEAMPEPLSEPTEEQATIALEEPPAPEPVAKEPSPVSKTRVAGKLRPDLNTMSEPEKKQLTNAILARQYFTEKSAVDQLFGKPLPQQNAETREEFHYPVRPNMIAMLDQPIPELPFAYTPDLVYFAYDPGVKGDLQRFWDVITPEFGWRTKYGTEVKCILVLVIVGCGWK